MNHNRGRKGIRTKDMIIIARERIDILFRNARKEALQKNFSMANRYTSLAIKIGMRYNIRIPKNYSNYFCKKCHVYLLPGYNSRIRLSKGIKVIHCLACGKIRRQLYKK